MINQIKSIIGDLETNNIDTLVMAKVNLQNLYSGYDQSGVDAPEWVIDGINTLSREIDSRNRAALQVNLKKLEASHEALAPAGEKRKKMADQIKTLKAKLQ